MWRVENWRKTCIITKHVLKQSFKNSPDAKIFCLIHKMDLVQEDQRDTVRKKKLQQQVAKVILIFIPESFVLLKQNFLLSMNSLNRSGTYSHIVTPSAIYTYIPILFPIRTVLHLSRLGWSKGLSRLCALDK